MGTALMQRQTIGSFRGDIVEMAFGHEMHGHRHGGSGNPEMDVRAPVAVFVHVDLNDALLALYFRFAASFGHQRRSAKSDPRRSAAVIIVDGFRRSRDHCNAIDRRSAAFNRNLSWIGSRWGLRQRNWPYRESAHCQE